MKKNKGITLVALIITIIVLLILAVVTINAVNEGSLFAHANNAATRYEEKSIEENALIANILTDMQEYAISGEAAHNQMSANGPKTIEEINNLVYMNEDLKAIVNSDYSVNIFSKSNGEWNDNGGILDLHSIEYVGYGKISEVTNENFEEETLHESFSNNEFSLNEDYHIFASYYYNSTTNSEMQFIYAISPATATEKSKLFISMMRMQGKLYYVPTLEYVGQNQ